MSQIGPLGPPSGWCLCPFLTTLLFYVSEATVMEVLVALLFLGGIQKIQRVSGHFLWYMMDELVLLT